MRTLYVGQFNIIPTRVLAHLKTFNVVCGRILHPGTPNLGDNVLSYHSWTHLTNKEGYTLTQTSERQPLFQGPRHTLQQGTRCRMCSHIWLFLSDKLLVAESSIKTNAT